MMPLWQLVVVGWFLLVALLLAAGYRRGRARDSMERRARERRIREHYGEPADFVPSDWQ